MAQNIASQSTDEESLKTLYDEAMQMFDRIENGSEATNSDAVQLSIKAAIAKFEKATNLVSLSGMFSQNEDLEELPTETLQYLLLPALLGTLSLKLCSQPRKGVINVAEIYFKDFLQRCKDYGVTDVEVPQTSSEGTSRAQNEQAKIANMVLSRQAKIKRYKEMKELKEKLSTLSKAMSSPTADDATKREYFVTLLLNYVNQALDELSSIEQEKPILEYMAKNAGAEHKAEKRERAPPLKPVIITRDALQKAVFGAGYPSLPTMTVEEFYDKRVRDGTFPGAGTNIPHTTIENADADPDEAEQIRKERLVEEDDEEALARQRDMDEYKDEHRRGWGNRHNRS
ncbi:immunoglobulin-binding protein 1 [Bicyclus anynana]|uniref:Immunoglobulin-binding protein 1 n=1 Tax=Bicyclus anynana TaxID=110368 RepID=A0A6J1NJM6_BICAN|nr:immunoglobulin-binding protein 1 [Bicyclus anynana]